MTPKKGQLRWRARIAQMEEVQSKAVCSAISEAQGKPRDSVKMAESPRFAMRSN
jgi:hypothetical protein